MLGYDSHPVLDDVESGTERVGEAYVVTADLFDDTGLRKFYVSVEKTVLYEGATGFGFSWPTEQGQEEYLEAVLRNGAAPGSTVLCHGVEGQEHYSTQAELRDIVEEREVEVKGIGVVPVEDLTGVFVKSENPLSWDRLRQPGEYRRDVTFEASLHLDEADRTEVLHHIDGCREEMDTDSVAEVLEASIEEAREHSFEWELDA